MAGEYINDPIGEAMFEMLDDIARGKHPFVGMPDQGRLNGTWGEQPESLALPNPGALRGDIPLSSPDEEIK